MNSEKYLKLFNRQNFSMEFKIYLSEKFCIPVMAQFVHGQTGRYVLLSVQGQGELPKNKDYVVFSVKNFVPIHDDSQKAWPRIVTCTCIVCILDVKGEKKLPRTFDFHFRTEEYDLQNNSTLVEERYVERKSVLANKSEYLDGMTLTVLVEATQEEWADAVEVNYFPNILYWIPSVSNGDFIVEENEKGLEVYLRQNSMPSCFLCDYSSVFRQMWETPMCETSEKRVLLRNEEIPACLCALFSLVYTKLVLFEVTVFDLYKIADKYDMPSMLEKCRKYIEKRLPIYNWSTLVEFAIAYDDKKLQRTAESYIEKYSRDSPEFGYECDIQPISSSVIKTKKEFETYLKNLSEQWVNVGPFSSLQDIPAVRIVNEDTNPESFDFYM